MKATELLDFLTAFYRDKLAVRNRHVAAAQFVPDYNFNNTYQYVINRDDMHVRWLQDAIVDTGGTPEEQPLPSPRARQGQGRPAQRNRPPTAMRRRSSSSAGATASTRCQTPATAACCG